MKERVHVEERLDTGRESDAEVRLSLADLRNINRFLGGRKVLRGLLDQQARRAQLTRFSVLDVATGAADLPALMREWHPHARIVGLDLQLRHLRFSAECLHSATPQADGIEFVCGDVFSPPFRAASLDFVTASLFIHHFTDEQLPPILRGLARLARRAVLINDLDRSRLPWLFARGAGRLIWRRPITHHDAPASIRRALGPGELSRAAMAAGFRRVEERWHWPFRRSLVIELSN